MKILHSIAILLAFVTCVSAQTSKVTTLGGVATNTIYAGSGRLAAIEVNPVNSSGITNVVPFQLRVYDVASTGGAWTNGGTTPKKLCNDIYVTTGTTPVTYAPTIAPLFEKGITVVTSVAGATNGEYNVIWK